jgi:guanine deaminase
VNAVDRTIDRSVVVATVMQTPDRSTLDIGRVAIAFGDDGVITHVVPAHTDDAAALVAAATRVLITDVGTYLLPGLVDLHVHAPQWPQLGTGLDLPLEEWLFAHTFPLEARYADLAFAASVWDDLVHTLVRHGTTTAVYFGTNDIDATTALAAASRRVGQRAYVGRVAMDHPDGTPEWYRDQSAEAGVAASARSIDEIVRVDGGRGLVQPIITPRFTPACTDALLTGLGELAAATGVLVQTHCSESDWAHGYAWERFGMSDTSALESFGLLRDATVLAHADHVSDDDASLLVARRAGIAHCPLSNAYFANAVLPTRALLDRGVRIGLGTDVAGGASPSLWSQCHDAVTVSRLLADGVDAQRPAADRGVAGSAIDAVTAFWLGTAGGAEVLGAPVGLLAPGRRFDAVLVDPRPAAGAVRVWSEVDDDVRVFEKIVRLTTPADIAGVWVDGVRLVSRP